MPSAVFRTAEHWQKIMLGALVAQGGLSDVANTSLFKTFISAVARCLDELGYEAGNLKDAFAIASAAGSDLDERAADILPVGQERIPAQPAKVNLVFARSNANTATALTVAAGTTVQDAAGNAFTTNASATFAVQAPQATGSQSITVLATASTPGSQGNVLSNTLTLFAAKPAGVDSVTNPAGATGGADLESDDNFRDRIYAYVAGLARSTPDALTSAVLGLADSSGNTILTAAVQESAATPGQCYLFIDNGSGNTATPSVSISNEILTTGLIGPPANCASGGESVLSTLNRPLDTSQSITLSSNQRGALVLGTHYAMSPTTGTFIFTPALALGEQISAYYSYKTGLVALAQKVVDGDPNDRANYPGIRAAGVQVIVDTPETIFEPIIAAIVVSPTFGYSTVQTQVQAALANVAQGLAIGKPLLVAALVQAAMNVPGVTDATITAPAQDITIDQSQLIRSTSVTVA